MQNAYYFLTIGGLAAYFKAYPTVKFVNKTIITPPLIDEMKEISLIGKFNLVLNIFHLCTKLIFAHNIILKNINFCKLLLLLCLHIDKNPAPGVCLPIIVKFCENAPYNYTIFPNYIGHFGQLDAEEV